MNQLFIPHELALKAKSKGFTNQCMAIYDEKGTFAFQPRGNWYQNSKEDMYNCAAPIYQQIVDWVREKHKIVIETIFYEEYIMATISELPKVEKFIWKDEENTDLCYALNKAIGEAFKLI